MSGMRLMLTTSAFVGTCGIGYAMWSVISPSDERKREILKNLPESNPVRMDETRKRSALMLQVLKDAAETNDNIARGFGPPKS
ncbi:ubiquinol-cytochrome-c reductase complex assembly factor 3 [Clupea harengus]|uniref:Ubiquinol-cytochrome-c reductase complex assembly factor 3 n=1 Tax=Clupea harengus TaxID=7950 RepID=A0A6P3WA23_CLUHA|nr:ubiquinol-cytochrome-c reductase complex assembly factor 3 [Clupea harengus]